MRGRLRSLVLSLVLDRGRRCAALATLVIGLSLYSLPAAYCEFLAPAGPPGPALVGHAWVADGVLHIEGDVSPDLPRQVAAALQAGGAVRRIALDSPGGVSQPAGAIHDMLIRRFHREIPAVVARGAICMSACIRILGAGRPQINDGARLMFHEARFPIDVSACAFCRLLARFHPALRVSVAERETMVPWVRDLSPRLLAFLEACPANPFMTPAGETITGAEYNAIVAGTAAFSCRDLANAVGAAERAKAKRGQAKEPTEG